MSGRYTINENLGDDVVVELTALNFQGNTYKYWMTKELGGVCSAIYKDMMKDIFLEYHNHAKVSIPWKTCPYPKGPNELNNLTFAKIEELLPPYIPGNEKWKIEMRFHRDDEELGGYNLYVTVRSEETLLKYGG